MFSHIMIGSNDIARSKKFYDALFTAIGGEPGTSPREGRLAYSHNGSRFIQPASNWHRP
jgi:catechol 2,3-dioxygenase-like lactoylglutathione lyase family enzyme